MKVVFFVSRNKDNQSIKNFVERKVSFVVNDQDNFEKTLREFDHFVDNGLLGEKCRLYVSLNRRDDEKVRKALLHYLIDHPELDLSKIDRKIASIAGKVENKAENKWLFDIDTTDESTIIAFKHALISAVGEDNLLQEYNTPNGRHIIVKHGFDSRELMTNWQHVVDLKRDEMQLFCFKEKN